MVYVDARKFSPLPLTFLRVILQIVRPLAFSMAMVLMVNWMGSLVQLHVRSLFSVRVASAASAVGVACGPTVGVS